ncbi:MAG: aminotransferase class V-fold PLP-dependent enzyme, partial [Clostridiales bacterium]|nr:aminotransferase class V-fold PLP-dependent enzyme [Clostridiales bacterium]
MTTAIDRFTSLRPEDYGLPGEEELRARLAEYFPEYAAPQTAAYNPTIVAEKKTKADNARANGFPVEKIRGDFPILSEKVDGYPLIWLDNAATTQRPRQVIDRLTYFYEHENSNVHRGAHTLAARSTDAFEGARDKIAAFIGAPSADDIIFVRGTTEGLNLIAQSYVNPLLRPGDEIVLTILEHHANIVPWQLIAEETGAILRVAPVDETGQVILPAYGALFGPRTKFASIAHVSNALGTVTPAAEMIAIAHGFGVPVCVDGAQSVSHIPVDVTAMDADFFVFSGHKIFGPTGIGAVYGKSDLLEQARPYQGGGNMIADVTFERTVYHPAPRKFEAGTGNIA